VIEGETCLDAVLHDCPNTKCKIIEGSGFLEEEVQRFGPKTTLNKEESFGGGFTKYVMWTHIYS